MKELKLSDLPNIGKVVESKLIEVGITSSEQLKELGSRTAFLRIRAIDTTACIRMLYGLEGAVQGIKDTLLPANTKEDLMKFFRTLSK